MAIQNPKKTIQISATLTSSVNEIVLIQNNLNRTLLNVNIPNQISLKHLQGWGNLSSLEEAVYPINEPRDTAAARQQKQAYFRSSAKIGVSFRIRPIGEAYVRGVGECCILDFYGVKPGFLYNILEYTGALEIAFGWALSVRQIDRGFGLLTSDDYISFTGYAKEESEFLQDENLVIIP